jgi:thiamine-monophosphate kinase
LGLAPDTEVEFVTELYRGLLAAAGAFNVAVVGGDLTKSSRFFITVCLTGRADPGLTRRRSDAKEGDAILVTGSLGGSAAALKLLKEGKRPTRGAMNALYARHTRPTPRVAEAKAAAAAGARAMQDVSDGLLADLTHICEASGLGARIMLDRVPVFPIAGAAGFTPAEAKRLALTGGEDYELLLTAPVAKMHKVKTAVEEKTGTPVTMIGEMTGETSEVVVIGADGRPLKTNRRGYDHFPGS